MSLGMLQTIQSPLFQILQEQCMHYSGIHGLAHHPGIYLPQNRI